jgi:O-antigen biosynthesis protein WbqP
MEDGSPIFFKQKRVGLNSSYFYIYKFRSMKTNTPNLPTDQLTNPDLYILKIGKIIRKLSLDELPNLINIFSGDMVFVGPRPALFNQLELIEKRSQLGIDKIKPGITGWAQVNGRDELTDAQKVHYDYHYYRAYSILLDIKILWLTIFNVLKSKGINH